MATCHLWCLVALTVCPGFPLSSLSLVAPHPPSTSPYDANSHPSLPPQPPLHLETGAEYTPKDFLLAYSKQHQLVTAFHRYLQDAHDGPTGWALPVLYQVCRDLRTTAEKVRGVVPFSFLPLLGLSIRRKGIDMQVDPAGRHLSARDGSEGDKAGGGESVAAKVLLDLRQRPVRSRLFFLSHSLFSRRKRTDRTSADALQMAGHQGGKEVWNVLPCDVALQGVLPSTSTSSRSRTYLH